jgi:DNA-binding response OmpR family regulator
LPLRILVVDDSETMRQMIRYFVQANGHQVVAEADSPESAAKSYAEHKPDLVTLDLGLKGGDGLSVLKSLRQLDPQAAVLIISGNSQKAVHAAALAAGATDFLTKPIDFDAFLAVLAKTAVR